ncbi:hypothetical protein GDO81_000014, partial [Engystomops pustulosus]
YAVQMDTSGVLFTRNLTTSFTWMDHGKKIQCAVSTGKKRTTKEITLNVAHAPKGVTIGLKPPSGNIKEGDLVTLTCQVNSSHPSVTTYTWYKDGQQISKEMVITFSSLSRNDHGKYRCEAENPLGQASSDIARLIVFYIKEGESVTLTCEVPGVGSDEVQYTWFKNNIVLKESSMRSINFPTVSISDSGYYYCKVDNDEGSDSSPLVIINVKYPPKSPTFSSFLESQHGNLAIIQCTVESNPYSELMVYKDDNLIGSSSSHGTPSERVQVTSTVNSLRLKIREVMLSDEGLYICVAKNSMGNSSASLRFSVETTRVIITPSSEIEEGKEVTLRCVATRGSEEGTTYTWYQNNKRLKEDMKGKELVLRRLSKSDTGSYFCKAHSSQGTSTSPAVTLHVLFPPRDLSLNSLVSSQVMLRAVIRCTVDSDPPSQMFLYRGRTLVASSTQAVSNERYELALSINSLQVEIQDVVLEDEGLYQCRANNSYGQMMGTLEFTAEKTTPIAEYKNTSCTWKDEQSLRDSAVSSLDSGMYYCKAWNNESGKSSAPVSLNVADAPRHLQVTSFQDTTEGKSAFIRCTVDSFPAAEMSLYRGGQVVASSRYNDPVNERYRVTSSHNELMVNIKNLKLEDEGKYNCTSRNRIGSASQSVYFSVQTARVLVSPSAEVLEGSQVTMACNFMKSQLEAITYIWYKDSRWLEKTMDNSLVLDNVKAGDAGYYHCVVQGSEDSNVSPSIFLHVSYGPRAPVMSSYWEAQSGQSGIIQCSVDSDPPSSLALYFRGIMICSSDSKGSSNDRIIVSTSRNMIKMEIAEVRLEDEGTYLCAANNSIGESRATVNFTAETTRIVISPSSVVPEGEAVNLTCVVATEAAGAGTYTWYKNGVLYPESSIDTLQLTNVTSEDGGAFHCRVQSPRGSKSSQSVILNVQYPPKNVKLKSFLDTEHSKVAIILGSVDSDPPSDLFLYKDGRLLASSTDGLRSSGRMHVYFLPNLLRLEITNIKSSDRGSYIFTAKNSLGTKQGSVMFNVEDVHVLISPSTELREGQMVTLTCEVLDNPQDIISYTWYKNSRWFQDVRAASLGLGGGVSSSDAGSYSCTAHTLNGSMASPPVSLSVLYPPRNLSIASFIELQGRQEGVVVCTVDSNPPSLMYLLKGNKSLDSSKLHDSTQRLKLSSYHNTLRMEIRDMTTDDHGEYTCQAHNSLGAVEKSIQFRVQSARLLVEPSEEIHEGRSVTLTCEVPRMENTTYTWYKNNKWLHEGPEKSYELVNVSSSETGSYQCLAKHWKGNRASSLVGLNVRYGPKNMVISSFLETRGRNRGIILCRVDSHPPSTIELYKNNLLLGSSRSRQTDRGQKHWTSTSYNYLRLEIRDIRAEDYGSYICAASNALGMASSSVDLNITDTESPTYKVITVVAIICILLLGSFIIVLIYKKR